jgi:DNA-directed RNA polymerase specialized sigma24 family protein
VVDRRSFLFGLKEGTSMSSEAEGSVTRWIGSLKAGGEAAAQPLWERYFDRLVHLARHQLRGRPRRAAVEDEEDAALSAFDSFCRGAARGRFPQLSDRDDLWRLLVVLTVRKALDQLERHRAAKRGGGRLIGESALIGGGGGGEAAEAEAALDRLVGPDPTPEFAARVAEQYRRLREALGEDSLRQVLDLRLEGYDRAEIAARLGCAVRTVTRKLEVIRRTWLENES